jgi:hypothetical protein
MKIPSRRVFALNAVIALTLTANPAAAQHERDAVALQDSAFDQRFFNELKRIFGDFSYIDLQRVFNTAWPVQCSDLVSDTGEWREVAFFNEHRDFGDWYRTSLDEVKKDPSLYLFKGFCQDQSSPVQLDTRFPIDQSFADLDGNVGFVGINVIENPPVSARVDNQTGAYTFDLPYLFRVSKRDSNPLYALSPRTPADRYAPEVSNHWECKSVAAENVTYQFLICHTTLVQHEAGNKNRIGTSAFSLLSDGREASSSVTLRFSDKVDPKPRSVETRPTPAGLGFRDSHHLTSDK